MRALVQFKKLLYKDSKINLRFIGFGSKKRAKKSPFFDLAVAQVVIYLL